MSSVNVKKDKVKIYPTKKDSLAMTSRRYALRDDQWERIKDLLPGREGYVGGTAFIQSALRRSGVASLPLQASRGGTYLKGLGTSELYTPAWVHGVKVECGNGYFAQR